MSNKQPTHLPQRTGLGWTPLLAVLLFLLVGGGVAWYLLHPKTVPTITVQRGRIIKAFYATGTVRPDREYYLKAKTQGSVVELLVRENDDVKQGQIIARIDARQLQLEVNRTQAELKEAQAQAADDAPQRMELRARLDEAKQQLEIAKTQAERNEMLYDKGVGSATDRDNAQRIRVQWANTIGAIEQQLGTWKIESIKRVDVAQANLHKAEADLADSEVRSPIAGKILERYVERDEVVSINQKLFLIAEPSDKLMKAAVDEEDIARVTIGQRVEMQLYAFSEPDQMPFRGKVQEILPTANPTNKTFEVKVAFDDPPTALRVGMTAELNFIDNHSARDNALIVPTTAIMDGKVYRAVGPGRYVPQDVKMGIRTLEQAEVLEGLKEGDVIVADAKQVAPIKLPKQKPPVVPTRKGDEVAEQ